MGEVITMVIIFAQFRNAQFYLVFTQTARDADFEKKNKYTNMNQEMELF